jgi:hypothetical protein
MIFRTCRLTMTGMVALCLSSGLAYANQPTAEERIGQLEAKLAALEAREASGSKELARTIDSILRDADKRSSTLMQNSTSMGAGYDDGFFIRSGDNWVLRPGALFQFRHNIWGGDDAGGDSDVENGFEVRNLQLTLEGIAFTPDLTYAIEWSNGPSSGELNLDHAWARWMFSDDWGTRIGQWKVPVSHEWLMAEGRLLAADRSLADTLFSSGAVARSQGVTVVYGAYDNDNPLYVEAGLHDGASEEDTNFQDDDADFGVAARVEYKVFGNWLAYSDFSARQNRDGLLVIGAGGDWSQSGDADLISAAIDAQWESQNGLGLFGALLVRNGDPGGGFDDETDFGLVAQAGYLLNPSWELFGRYSGGFFDLDRTEGGTQEDTFHELTVGVNYFLGENGSAGHRAKFTVDFSFLPDGLPGTASQLGYIGNGFEEEWVIRAQFQLWI